MHWAVMGCGTAYTVKGPTARWMWRGMMVRRSATRAVRCKTFQDLRVLFRPVLRIFKPLILNLMQSHFENLETTPFL